MKYSFGENNSTVRVRVANVCEARIFASPKKTTRQSARGGDRASGIDNELDFGYNISNIHEYPAAMSAGREQKGNYA